MEYILLDNFNGNLNIVCKDDGSGETLVFSTLKEAQDNLEGLCQDGQIIPLNTNIMNLIGNAWDFVAQIMAEEGKENFNNAILKELEEVLDIK